MAKKVKKKTNKAIKKAKKKVEKKQEGELPVKVSKGVKEKENRQLIWFFFWIALIFVIFLGVYFYIEGEKHFEFETIEWNIEEYQQFDVYHGRFPVLSGKDITFNLYHRIDPRENEVKVEGTLSEFLYGGYISFSPEVDNCRGDIARISVDLGSFLKSGVGVGIIEAATTDPKTANETPKKLVNCEVEERTVVILEMGEESLVSTSLENPSCYTITIQDCNDIAPIEKFMVRSVQDFRGKYGWISN